jgi:hypothetical protein
LAWGAQLEQRSAVTAYTPTTTQPITNYIPVLETAAAGVARFDHNPTTGESLGLLIEEQRTNLWVRSDDFANASWTKVRATIESNVIIAPDGTLTGDKFVASTDASATHFIRQDVAVTSGTSYTQTVYAKAGEYTQIVLGFDADSSQFADAKAVFTLTGNGSISTITGTFAATSITLVGNGWYRCQVTAAATATVTAIFRVYAATGGTNSFTGDGYSGIYIWGAQLEAGAFPTSYIPTVAATVTRNADAASMTGANFTSWFNNGEGTIYVESISPNSFSRIQASINDGTNNNKIEPALSSGNFYLLGVNVAGAAVGSATTANTATANTASKTAGAYRVNDFAVSLNAGTVATDTSGTLPIVDRMFIGQRTAGSVSINGTIKKIAYYPKRLANAELQALTTV